MRAGLRRSRARGLSGALALWHRLLRAPGGAGVRVLALLRKSPRGWTSRSGRGFEGYAEALALQRVNGAAANVLGIATIVVVGAQVLVVGLASQEMVDGDEDS